MHLRGFITALLLSLAFLPLTGQDVTRVTGTVTDAETGEPLAFVDVGFVGTYVGVFTDDDGNFELESRFGSDSIYVSYLGYNTIKRKIQVGKRQNLKIALVSQTYVLKDVTVVEKKGKYSKKNNPSLELAKKITKNKKKNHLRSLPYFSYDQHEKIKVDMNNITEKFQKKRAFKGFEYVWDYIDTSEVNGRNFLPLFLKETLSEIYYRKSSNTLKEFRKATRYTEFNKDIDANTISDVMDAMYQDIDIYQDDMSVMEMQFVSPLSSAGPNYYRYYILDTLEYKGRSVINLAFLPAVKGNRGFTGSLYVTNDDRYTVVKVDMGVIKNINLNFIRDLRIVQEFEPVDTNFVLTKDELVIDYSLTDNGLGFFGTRTLYFDNFSFEPPPDESIFNGLENVINSDSLLTRDSEYWEKNRIEKLTQEEVEVYEMIDKLVNDPKYRVYSYITKALSTGYLPVGPVEFGIIATFFSFNDVEGLNVRLGARSTYQLTKKIMVRGSLAYAKNTDLWKYSGNFMYSFNKEWKANPRHFLSFGIERSASFPGQELEFFSPDNLLLSFRRGRATDMLLQDMYDINYTRESNGFNFSLGAQRRIRQPYGTLVFSSTDPEDGSTRFFNEINSTEVYGYFRFAPNETFIQGKDYRTQLYNEYPIIELRLTQGLGGVFDGDYTFSRAYLNVFKQIEWTRIGTTDMVFEAGKTWGNVPYIMQFIPRGNQTYANFLNSFNMMNFLEFSNDQFISANIEHFSYGYFFNRIPLIKHLKFREVFGLKVLYGSLSDKNNPNKNPELIQFVKDELGQSTTYTMNGVPYIEGSFGITNIFKVLRVDVIQRFTHLDNPRMATLFGRKGMGIRFNFQVEF